MGTQPTMQGRSPGEQVPEEGDSVVGAIGTVVGAVALVVLIILGGLYLGGWAAHVAVDIARSGWESK